MVVGETIDIQAVVVQELSTRSYIGCPNDSKKIPDAIEGKEAVCPKCGNIVKPKVLQWALFLVGDVTDEIIASFPPSIMNRPTEGMIIVAQGLLGENEEFLVYRWSLPSDTKTGATPEAPLQTFFKPSAPPTTTSATPITSATPTPSAPTTSSPQVTSTPTTSAPVTPTTTLMCDQCNAGPFANPLALQGHKIGAHGPKKTGKRLKKPGVGGYTPVSPPTTAALTPITATLTPSTPISPVSPLSPVTQPSQPTSVAPNEPDSKPISLVASPEQALLPNASAEKTNTSPEKPIQGPNDSLLTASQIQAPTTSPITSPVSDSQALTTPSKEAVKEEIKAVEGASEGSIKFAKVCGLIAKPLQEFKLHFEVNFPKDDMNKAIEAAHCAVVDNKVVFVGG